MKRIFVGFFFICFFAHMPASSFAQDTTADEGSRIRISLLTCTPGDELYSIFGHSAIRVIDSNSVTDIVYNYGTFNFDDEGFYLKFIRGKLLYYISIVSFQEFKYDYQVTNRGITEQVLRLSDSEKITLQHALIENLEEKNRYYQYDFFFDNCTTRLRDLIVKYKQPHPDLPAVRPSSMRFREAIHEYLDRGHQPWSKLGIDILLGAPTDRIMTAREQQFLPDNLMMALDSSVNTTVVQSSQFLYPLQPQQESGIAFTPWILFMMLFIFYGLMHILCNKNYPVFLSGLDGLLFFCVGLLGIILILMWVGTDHSMTKNNYNLLWALPSHLIISFFIGSKKNRVKKYFLFTILFECLVMIAWLFLPQQMNNALLPLVALIIWRSWVRYNKIPLKP